MIDLKNDPDTWDLSIENGDLVLVDKSDCAAQHVAQRIKLFKGEWFLDLDAGIPWFQDILKKNPNPNLVDGILKNAIIESPDIVELLSFNLDYDTGTRELTVDFSARSVDGNVDIQTTIGA
jgi:hypothetical protein